jgi:hypothetical protein
MVNSADTVKTDKKLLAVLFILNAVIISPLFFPDLGNFNLWDEAQYITRGKSLWNGYLPDYTSNPLVSILYALSYIPIQDSPYWLLRASAIGRLINFTLLWVSAILVSKKLIPHAQPVVTAGLLAFTPVLSNLLKNSSDALFASMSAFALWQLLSYKDEKKIRHLWTSSIFISLAALSRNDGLILYIIYLPVCLLLNGSVKRKYTVLAAVITPFLLIVGGYILLHGLYTGDFELGVGKRFYIAFEQGQGVVYSDLYPGKDAMVDGVIDCRKIFGTAEENNYSVLKAITRNPEAFLKRALQNAASIPRKAKVPYGRLISIFLALMTARGIIELLTKKRYATLGIMLAWTAYLLTYFITFFRQGYLLLPYAVTFTLASIGLTTVASNSCGKKERYAWIAVIISLTGLGLMDANPEMVSISIIYLLGFNIIWHINQKSKNNKTAVIGVIIILCTTFIVTHGYPTIQFKNKEATPEEGAIIYLRENFEQNSRIGASTPGVLLASDMWPEIIFLDDTMKDKKAMDEKDFLRWIKEKKLKAIYVDKYFREYRPNELKLIENQTGKTLEKTFETDNEEIQIYVVKKETL